MKTVKIWNLLLYSLAVFFLLYSCQRETETEINENITFKSNQDPEEIIVGCNPYTTYWCLDCHQYCTEEGNNCAPCVIVTPTSSIQYLNELIGMSSSDVVKFFSEEENYKEIFPCLLDSDCLSFLSALLSGNYIISDVVTSDDKNRAIYIAENINDGTCLAFTYAVQ